MYVCINVCVLACAILWFFQTRRSWWKWSIGFFYCSAQTISNWLPSLLNKYSRILQTKQRTWFAVISLILFLKAVLQSFLTPNWLVIHYYLIVGVFLLWKEIKNFKWDWVCFELAQVKECRGFYRAYKRFTCRTINLLHIYSN